MMPSNNCSDMQQLRFEWYDNKRATDLARLKMHHRACGDCVAHSLEMKIYANEAIMPPMDDELSGPSLRPGME